MELDRQVRLAVETLREGGTIAFPTDTVYGLGAHPFLEKAVEKVYQLKKRPRSSGLPLLLADAADFESVARSVPELAWRLAERFLPGGLTLVLWKKPCVPDAVTGGSDKVALRVPNHPVPLALIRGLKAPLIGTSANLTGSPSPLRTQEIYEQLGDKVDLIIEGGRCPGGVESTVLDVTGELPVILREGAISRGEIERVCQTPAVLGETSVPH